MRAVNFFTEYKPEDLRNKMEEVFTFLGSKDRFEDLWKRLAEMFKEEPSFAKGANPEWNRAGDIK